jgi:glycosyltransferase involved in cell wall biosynthesis
MSEMISSDYKRVEAPLVSVIMNCLNGEKYLKEAIDSVYAQTYKNWEIIFWDNASTDLSAEIANSYDKKLRYFRGEETIPLGAARNKAMEKAEGEFIAFLDCDDIWMPEKLSCQVVILVSNQEFGFVCSNCVMIDQKTGEKNYNWSKVNDHVLNVALQPKKFEVYILTVLVRMSIAKNIKFDTNLECLEDYDFFLRCLIEKPAFFLAESLAYYRIHPEMMSVQKISKATIEHLIVLDKFRALDKKSVLPNGFIENMAKKTAIKEVKRFLSIGLQKEVRKRCLPWLGRDLILTTMYVYSFFGKFINYDLGITIFRKLRILKG